MGESWLDQQLDSFRPAVPIEEEWLHEGLAASDAVQQEDADICESVQGGWNRPRTTRGAIPRGGRRTSTISTASWQRTWRCAVAVEFFDGPYYNTRVEDRAPYTYPED